MFWIYPGEAEDRLDLFAMRYEVEIPRVYRDFLRAINGAFCFGMSLYGIPGSLPFLDRSVLQCHSLASAVQHWTSEYRVPRGLLHFGSRDYSRRELAGYFFDQNGSIRAVRKRGKVVGRWDDFTAFLSDELLASEALENEMHPPQWPA